MYKGRIYMITLLSNIFIKDNKNYTDEHVRRHYGELASLVGIFFNILLFSGKFAIGLVTNAISVTADAFNNLSDAGSSIITLLGFKMSNQKPDNEHPFGHGRIEYISGLLVSVLILIMAFELIKTSFSKIITPEEIEVSKYTFFILGGSIIIKIYMFLYNTLYGKKISSSAMKATAIDSLSDSIATTVVLISAILHVLFDWHIDAYAGIAVGLFIAYAGLKTLKETISPLLGQTPDREVVESIEKIVLECEVISGIHDMIIHDYGPTRTFVSLHAEVPCDKDILEIHDYIDQIEFKIKKELKIEATIHMDPIDTKDAKTLECKEKVKEIISSIDSKLSIHDFRMVHGETHSNVLFDLVIPHKFKISEDMLTKMIEEEVRKSFPSYNLIIQVDNDYAGSTNKFISN